MEEKQRNHHETVFHDFKGSSQQIFTTTSIVIFVLVLLAGIGSGYFLSKNNAGNVVGISKQANSSGTSASKGTIVGTNDLSTFKDSATGVMTVGGIDGEGQYHLVRPGGDSQNVYLTSSLVDLSQFVGKKVKVNGQTQAAKKAGWLMDVGRVEVLE